MASPRNSCLSFFKRSKNERKQEFRGGLCTCTFKVHFYSCASLNHAVRMTNKEIKEKKKQQRGSSLDSNSKVKVRNLPSKLFFISSLLLQICSEKEGKQEFRGGLCTCTFKMHLYSRPSLSHAVRLVRSIVSTSVNVIKF